MVSVTSGSYAPPPLRVVQEFVNTADRRRGQDVLASPKSLVRWLQGQDLLGHGPAAGEPDLALALRVREALRDAFDPTGTLGAEAADTLNDIVRRAEIVPQVNASGLVRLSATARGVVGAVGGIVALSLLAQFDGSARRLKACAAPECRRLFYDESRNRSVVWCDDPACGGRHQRLRVLRARRT